MWDPKYTITNRLLRTTREIGEALGEIRNHSISKSKYSNLITEARALSTFASTSIEGNPLPLTDVKRLLKNAPGQLRDTEREILNYNHALEWVQAQVEAGTFELRTETFEKVQGMVVESFMESAFDIGHIRQKPVVIRDPRTPDSIVFMPPDHKDVSSLCENLFHFLRENLNGLDPVLLAGLFHKQAVIIHPFMDGNGRSTRLMASAILGMTGLELWSLFSFEAYYNHRVTRYFEMVGEQGDYYDLCDRIDFTHWLEYFAEGILDELRRVQKSLTDKPLRLEPHHEQILQYLEKNGSITQSEYGTISNRSLAARKHDFAKLLGLGLIRREGGGRSVYYVKI